MSKKGLGRGLGALITESQDHGSDIKEIKIKDILPNPFQPRKDFDEEKLQELADSIKEHGLIQPILVKPEGNKYYIIAGERRFRASEMAGLDQISCIVRECDQLEMTEKALIENIQRDDLSPVEEGLAYARLMDDYGFTQEQVAKRVGKGRPTIANLLRIIQLPQEVLELINNGRISLGHAKVLLSLENSQQQIALAQEVAKDKLSVRETEIMITKLQKGEDKQRNQKQAIIKHDALLDVEDKLNSVFQTKVNIRGDEQKGKIEIDYYSKEELDRLLELWKIQIS